MVILPKWAVTVISAVIMGVGLLLGATIGKSTERANAVCHSKTEDSVITDCNYHNGAWYRK